MGKPTSPSENTEAAGHLVETGAHAAETGAQVGEKASHIAKAKSLVPMVARQYTAPRLSEVAEYAAKASKLNGLSQVTNVGSKVLGHAAILPSIYNSATTEGAEQAGHVAATGVSAAALYNPVFGAVSAAGGALSYPVQMGMKKVFGDKVGDPVFTLNPAADVVRGLPTLVKNYADARKTDAETEAMRARPPSAARLAKRAENAFIGPTLAKIAPRSATQPVVTNPADPVEPVLGTSPGGEGKMPEPDWREKTAKAPAQSYPQT